MSRALDRLVTVALGGVAFGLAVELAVLECFLLPSYAGPVPVPLSILVAPLGNLALPALAYRLSGSRAVGLAPVAGWLFVVVLAAVPRAEGDLIVTGSLRGLAFLLLGAVAAAYAAARVLAVRPVSGDRRPVVVTVVGPEAQSGVER